MRHLLDSIWIFLGAGIGANSRYWIGYWWKGSDLAFPWHTFTINVCGSLMIGVYLAMSLRYGWSKSANLLFAVGLCGGFTTFSAYSAEVVRLLEQRQLVPAAGYFLATNILCIVACFAGMQVTRWIATR